MLRAPQFAALPRALCSTSDAGCWVVFPNWLFHGQSRLRPMRTRGKVKAKHECMKSVSFALSSQVKLASSLLPLQNVPISMLSKGSRVPLALLLSCPARTYKKRDVPVFVESTN